MRHRPLAVAVVLTLCATGAATAAAGASGAAPLGTQRNGPDFLSVVTLGTADAWAVGVTVDKQSGHRYAPLADHWDGTGWTTTTPVDPGHDDATLTSVGADSSSDVWAVGYVNAAGLESPLAERWDGTSWARVHARRAVSGSSQLTGVAAIGPDDVWVIGEAFVGGYAKGAFAQHWNGTSWTSYTLPDGQGGQALAAQAVSASGSSDVWVTVGQTAVDHWDGSAWTAVPTSSPGGLHGVSAESPTDAWAVGDEFNGSEMVPVAEHWDGTSWSATTISGSGTVGSSLTAVDAVSPDDVWAVGSSSLKKRAKFRSKNLIEHWDGSTWSVVSGPDSGGDDHMLAASGNSASDAWASSLGKVGSLEHWDGSRWQVVTP